MASESLISCSVDPLSGFNGPSLFPRTIRASIDGPVPVGSKDLDSIHQFMKSLDLRSPEKLMNEAKRIVDGGAALLDSNLASFAENVGISDAIATKGKDRPQERRQGLGLARKRAPFSLKTSVSQPSVSLEQTLNIDQLQDPDEFFDAYERLENAKKELQKRLGGKTDNVNNNKPSTNARLRRPGILGKSYNYKHRYSSMPFENDNLMSSQEAVEQDIPSAHRDKTVEKIVDPVPNQDIDQEELEFTASLKKTESELNNILDELLSCNNEDLEGDGALNLLQERLKIKPLDLENLSMPGHRDVQKTNILAIGESVQKTRKSSLIIDNVLKNVNGKRPMDHDQKAQNPVTSAASPTPPRSPFASLSSLKKRILQLNPLRDPFSPLNVDFSVQNVSPVQPTNKLKELVNEPTGLSISSELKSQAEVEITEPTSSSMDAQNAIGSADSLSALTLSPVQPTNKLKELVNEPTDLSISSELKSQAEVEITEPTSSSVDAQKAIGSADSLSVQLVDENASMQTAKTNSRPNKEPDYNIEEATDAENLNDNQSNPSVLADEATGQQSEAEQQLKVHQTKLPRRKREAGDERLRKAHPLRKSLADSGTSFETGVRRSKRIKMRPLEYWKGERFLYGRVDDSLKLIGVKYISPGKGDTNLKVKPYMLSESPKYKELLELASRH